MATGPGPANMEIVLMRSQFILSARGIPTTMDLFHIKTCDFICNGLVGPLKNMEVVDVPRRFSDRYKGCE
jgi:hypothetical protein